VYGSEAKTCVAVDSLVRNKFNVSDENVEFAIKEWSDAKRDESDDADMNNYSETPKFAADADMNVLAVKDDAFMVDKKYVNASDLNLSSDEIVIISDRDVLEKEVDDVPDVENVVSDGNKSLVLWKSGKIAFNGSHAKSVAGNKDVDGSESKANDVESVAKDKLFVSSEDVDSNVKKMFNGDDDVEFSQQNYVVTGDKMLVSDEDNEMIEVVSIKETIIISDDDEVPVVGSSDKKAVSNYTFSSDDDDIQIVCVKNSNGKCCHDDPFFGGMPPMKHLKNHHRGPIALQFVLDEASEDEE
ncbi:hypothetical protein Tco_1166177, partial [Tanacetum coccineum]